MSPTSTVGRAVLRAGSGLAGHMGRPSVHDHPQATMNTPSPRWATPSTMVGPDQQGVSIVAQPRLCNDTWPTRQAFPDMSLIRVARPGLSGARAGA
jgi:hypothetical protein